MQRVRCDIERRGRRPGRIGGRVRVAPGAAADPFRGNSGLPPYRLDYQGVITGSAPSREHRRHHIQPGTLIILMTRCVAEDVAE